MATAKKATTVKAVKEETKPKPKRTRLQPPELIPSEKTKAAPKKPAPAKKAASENSTRHNKIKNLLQAATEHSDIAQEHIEKAAEAQIEDTPEQSTANSDMPPWEPETIDNSLEASATKAKQVKKRLPTKDGCISFEDMAASQKTILPMKDVPPFAAKIDFNQYLKR